MKNFCLATFVAMAAMGCQQSTLDPVVDPTTDEPSSYVSELVNVTLGASSGTITSKVGYEPNSDASEYTFSWTEGDQVSVFVPGVTGNENQLFVAGSSEASTTLSGTLYSWEGDQTIYSVYPYSADGYTYDSDNNSISFDNSSQTIDLSSDNTFANGLMVTSGSGELASADEVSMPDLGYTQVMSFFQVDLVDVPEGETLTYFGFSSESEVFISSAEISLTSGEVVSGTAVYSTSLGATISGQSGTTASINLAVLPVSTTSSITMTFKTVDAEYQTKTYVKEFESGLTFSGNTFMSSESGSFSLTEDATEEGTTSELTLASFNTECSFVPSSDTWTIVDASAITENFEALRTTLQSLTNREITCEFPNLLSLPSSALSSCTSLVGIELPIATELGVSALYGCTGLTSVEFPSALNIGESAMEECSYLESVSLPKVTTIGTSSFASCSALSNVSAPIVETVNDGAFKITSSLKSLDLPEATSIGSMVFNESGLESISCPKLLSVDYALFTNCNSLTSVNLPEVTTIAAEAFSANYSLTSIELPKASSIGNMAFFLCTKLESVSLPSVTEIGNQAFVACTSLTSLEIATNDGTKLTSIGDDLFVSSIWDEVVSALEGNIDLTIGYDNGEYLSGSTLTVGDYSYTFKSVTVIGGESTDITASAGNAAWEKW